MTEAATYVMEPIRRALIGWLQEAIRTEDDGILVTVSDTVEPDDGRKRAHCVLDQLPGVRTTIAPMVAGTMLTARYVVTTLGPSRSVVGNVSDRVRVAMAAPDDDGEQEPIALPGVLVLRRESLEDGAFDSPGGVLQWVESFELDLVPGSA